MKPCPIHMECRDCGQRFDLLNSYWPKPEANSKWLHTSGTGHIHYTVVYTNGMTLNKTERAK